MVEGSEEAQATGSIRREMDARRVRRDGSVREGVGWPTCEWRDRALFDLAIDSKLRGCDLVKIKIGELVSGGRIRNRAIVIQQKTNRPVQFEILEPARSSILAWLERRGGGLDEFAFPSRIDRSDHLSTRQYARLVDEWVTELACAGRTMALTRCGAPRPR